MRASFTWISDLIQLGFQRTLLPNDIDGLPPNQMAEKVRCVWPLSIGEIGSRSSLTHAAALCHLATYASLMHPPMT